MPPPSRPRTGWPAAKCCATPFTLSPRISFHTLQETQAMPRERALGEFVRQQLRPLSARDDVTRYNHILNWEAVQPTEVYRKLVSEEAAPFLGVCGRSDAALHAPEGEADQGIADYGRRLARRSVHAVFIRYREQLAMPPVSLSSLTSPRGEPALISYQRVGAIRTCAGRQTCRNGGSDLDAQTEINMRKNRRTM